MVRATFAGFSTALSALQASQKRLDITGQNLANMNTPGYTRQQLKTSSFNYTNPISHYMNGSEVSVGFGVKMDAVTQVRDPYLDAQYRNQMTKSGYTDSIQTSLDRLSQFLDESHIEGIRQAFDDIRSTLFNMQDSAKVNDTIYESELRSRIQALTNLLNDGARQIEEAQKEELSNLNGAGTSEGGAMQQVNNILLQISQLNRQIKQNQIYGQPSLELMDERNLLLDELSSYIPIEVTYYKDYILDGSHGSGLTDPEEPYYTSTNGTPIGKKDWPDDLRVTMVYQDNAGNRQEFVLVEGTLGTGLDNIGGSKEPMQVYQDANGQFPDNVIVSFTGPRDKYDSDGTNNPMNKVVYMTSGGTKFASGTGSVQASLDMLWKTGNEAVDPVKGYQYYMGELDHLAETFANVMNTLNNLYEREFKADPSIITGVDTWKKNILVDKTSTNNPQSAKGITAANIGISAGWINGDIHISTNGTNETDTVINMLEAMTASYPYTKIKDPNTKQEVFTKANGFDLGNNSFVDYINHVSTVLANDSYNNTNALKNNVTVLNGIQNSRDSISGVSLDEEASNMMMFMSAYNAASRLMTTLDEALNTLINGTGVVGR